MKKYNIFVAIFFIVLAMSILFVVLLVKSNNIKSLVYDIKESSHESFAIKDGYVIVKDSITVRNPTKQDISFLMYADMSEDYGLVTEKTVPACEEETLKKQTFYIKAESIQSYPIYFKSNNGDKKTKYDRLPPKDIIFEVTK
jgi:hypothetical protein